MEYYNKLTLFWTILWCLVLVGAIVAFFWKPAAIGVAIIAAIMVGVFLVDYIRMGK